MSETSLRLFTRAAACSVIFITCSAAVAADSIMRALDDGAASLTVRPRYEFVDQSGIRDASALTIGTHLGFTTGAFHGFTASVEAANVTAIDGSAYNQAGLNPGGAGRAVVADPAGTEINQVWLQYASEHGQLKVGRQRLVLDNARFVGDVGWRQNMQTFDAITATAEPAAGLKLTYSYLDRINRIFGDDHPAGVWQSDSHVFNAAYRGLPAGTVTAYAYLLDFESATANSTATWGLSLAGARPLGENRLTYRTELAMQSDRANNPVDYFAHYYAADAGFVINSVTFGIGYEVLGSDNGAGFVTPLATLHAFNGWADRFLATPADGLRDFHGKVSVPLPRGLSATAVFHHFTTDSGDDLGTEVDVVVSRKFTDNLSVLVKFADFHSSSATEPDVTKFWAQAVFSH